MSSASSNTSLEATLPPSIKTYRSAYVEGSQFILKASSPPSTPPGYSKSHLARSRSPSPQKVAHHELSFSSPPPSPAESQSVCIHEKGLTASSPPFANAVLPKSAYNYESYVPRTPPSVISWSRKQLDSQTTSTSTPVFLSCNLTNPVHLASILAHGCAWEVVEHVAENMTPAVEHERIQTEYLRGGVSVHGVLVGGLVSEAMELLGAVMKRRWGERCKQSMEEVCVRVEDGEEVSVAAYVYRAV